MGPVSGFESEAGTGLEVELVAELESHDSEELVSHDFILSHDSELISSKWLEHGNFIFMAIRQKEYIIY